MSELVFWSKVASIEAMFFQFKGFIDFLLRSLFSLRYGKKLKATDSTESFYMPDNTNIDLKNETVANVLISLKTKN